MCENLKLKTAIMIRLWDASPYGIEIIALQSSSVLGTRVTPKLLDYVLTHTYEDIVRDIAKGEPIALELDNLQPNWD